MTVVLVTKQPNYDCIVPLGILPWEIQSRTTQPTVHAECFIHRTLTWTSGSLTCAQMLMHAIAHGGVRTPEESLH